MSVVVDSNAAETFLAAELQKRGVAISRQKLDVADVIVESADVRFLVERKTVDDLAASIVDGRFRSQRARILSRDPNDDQREIPVLMMQGLPPEWTGNMHGRLSATALHSSLTHAALSGFSVLWCPSSLDCATAIEKLIDCAANPAKIAPPAVNHHSSCKRKRNTNDGVWEAMLATVPGISLKVAAELAKLFPNMQALVDATDLANTKVGGRRLGPAIAVRLQAILR